MSIAGILAAAAADGAPREHRASLSRVLDHLGSTLLNLAAGSPATAPEVSAVVIYDPLDAQPMAPGTLVLAVGVHGARDVVELIEQIAADRGCGLVVRESLAADADVRRVAAASGIVLLGLARGAAWTQLARLLHGLLAGPDLDDSEHPDMIAGLPAGDLFTVASAISSLLDAPVTIEDRSSRVLAFSGRQDEADQPRVETILGRQVPQRYIRLLEQHDTFQQLYRSERPVFIDLPDPTLTPRAAIAVRAGDEILGSIWVAVRQPLSPARQDALCDAANLVALHLLRLRAGADVERRLRAELVATALEGSRGAAAALARLRLAGEPVVVLALDIGGAEPGGGRPARVEAERAAATDALSVHLSAVHAHSAVALLDGIAYALVPIVGDPAAGELRALRTAEEYLERVGQRFQGRIGVGRVADSIDGLSSSRRDTERVLQVLRDRPGMPRAARLADVQLEVLLHELAALADADDYVFSGGLERLIAYDAKHKTALLPSLRSWLDGLDAIASAKDMHVHVNTFRYRLRRVAEIAEVDLEDPQTRFALMLELRLLDRVADARVAATEPPEA